MLNSLDNYSPAHPQDLLKHTLFVSLPLGNYFHLLYFHIPATSFFLVVGEAFSSYIFYHGDLKALLLELLVMVILLCIT